MDGIALVDLYAVVLTWRLRTAGLGAAVRFEELNPHASLAEALHGIHLPGLIDDARLLPGPESLRELGRPALLGETDARLVGARHEHDLLLARVAARPFRVAVVRDGLGPQHGPLAELLRHIVADPGRHLRVTVPELLCIGATQIAGLFDDDFQPARVLLLLLVGAILQVLLIRVRLEPLLDLVLLLLVQASHEAEEVGFHITVRLDEVISHLLDRVVPLFEDHHRGLALRFAGTVFEAQRLPEPVVDLLLQALVVLGRERPGDGDEELPGDLLVRVPLVVAQVLALHLARGAALGIVAEVGLRERQHDVLRARAKGGERRQPRLAEEVLRQGHVRVPDLQ
mmetsp:Transcript_15719/g.40489  ORF Transcript_15719/g.40489 Transcript_15719/m.40489 type:complete len:341 (+) Transcript_15719:1045-2067(+)